MDSAVVSCGAADGVRFCEIVGRVRTRVVFEEKVAGVQGFGLEGRAVGRDESPMTDFAAKQSDETD